MRRFFLILLTALVACSGHTVTEFNVDVYSYLKASNTTLKLTFPSGLVGGYFIPDNPPGSGSTVSLPIPVDVLESGKIQLTAQLAGGTSGTNNVMTLELRIASTQDTGTMFDNLGDDIQLATVSKSVAPNTTELAEINLSLPSDNANAFKLIQKGSFKLALRISATGGTDVTFDLTKLNVSVSGRLFKLIPPS